MMGSGSVPRVVDDSCDGIWLRAVRVVSASGVRACSYVGITRQKLKYEAYGWATRRGMFRYSKTQKRLVFSKATKLPTLTAVGGRILTRVKGRWVGGCQRLAPHACTHARARACCTRTAAAAAAAAAPIRPWRLLTNAHARACGCAIRLRDATGLPELGALLFPDAPRCRHLGRSATAAH